MNVNDIIKLPKWDMPSAYNNRKQMEEHVEKVVKSFHDTTIESKKLQALEEIWTNICGIANVKKLMSHNEELGIKTWIYSFKDDSMMTVFEKCE